VTATGIQHTQQKNAKQMSVVDKTTSKDDSVQGGGEKKDGGKRIPFCGLTVTFLASVSGRNE
jgi:hypothetical protein